MTASHRLLLAALAAAGLAAWASASLAAADPPAELGDGDLDLSKIIPGMSLEGLTQAQRETVLKVAREGFCYCGCPHTLAGCLREHKQCKHAPRMLALAARLAAGGMAQPEVQLVLTDYYASFDSSKRRALDVKAFGPPLGNAAAPVSLVEFSDFTCPYCQMMRPKLEEFVRSRPARLKLYYKPFPLSSHEHSLEAAQAAEWARDKGIFWAMHDSLFEHPHALSADELAATAERLGADPADLRQALEARRHAGRIEASKQEARAAGITGTPSLFFDGRRLVVPADTEAMLEFTLEDEEEWNRNRGWARD